LAIEFGVSVSIDTLKLICKKVGFVWKRVRKSLWSKQDQAAFEVATEKIKVLIQALKDKIDLCYLDESGITLEPCFPYAWQPIGTIEIPNSKSKYFNVLGFVNRDCEFDDSSDFWRYDPGECLDGCCEIMC
jgi:hypothetical protein